MVVDSTIRFNDRMDGPSVSLGSKLSNAKVSFAIFKRDIKRLLMNPVALVVTLGVCVIPSLYAWYNIVANWDPYGNTQGIKIAIANNDQGTQNDLVGELNAGDKVVSRSSPITSTRKRAPLRPRSPIPVQHHRGADQLGICLHGGRDRRGHCQRCWHRP